MKLLINKQTIAKYRQLSGKRDDAVIRQYIQDAQFIDLQGLIGNELYNNITLNKENHTELLKGGTYEYNGTTYTNVGLEAVLSHYAYARLSMFGFAVQTSYDLVQKLNDKSAPVDSKAKQIIYKHNQQIGYNYWLNVKDFLDRTEYELWNTGCNRPSTSAQGFKIRKITNR